MGHHLPRRHLVMIALLLCIAALLRAWLLLTGSVSFHADEAVVGLMARHILQGERPTFFYGQAYMGSLDAWLVAGGFWLFGRSVLVIRLVQSILYLLVVASGYWAGWRLSGRWAVALVAGLVMAMPPVVVVLYTTATLGGYNELLLLGNLILILGWDVTHEHARCWWRWALLGVCAGLGLWTHGLIGVYLLPVGLLGLRRFSRRLVPFYLLAALCFVIGFAPWWVFDLRHDHAALSTYFTHRQTGEFAGIGIPYAPPGERAVGLVFIGLPTVLGMRFPWSGSFFLLPVGAVVLVVFAAAIYRLARDRNDHNPLKPDARALVLGVIGLFCVVFVASHFGADPTGRYFLPLLLPLGICLGALVETVCGARRRLWQVGIVAAVIGYYVLGQVTAAYTSPGFTTQFDPVSHLDNDHDDALIAFLSEHDLDRGYTNYWVAFRLAFLTGERMQYSAALPYKKNLSYNAADNRYKPYVEATARADRVAYITTRLPALDERLEAAFAERGITYRLETIGPFHVYYDFSEHVTPVELGRDRWGPTDEP
ncbi:MAG: glycosyltransferase family 39 protein [Anaerolineae bacterium]|nr:glycosyltransferase family 39 protein [Anaerolineae bacterium]